MQGMQRFVGNSFTSGAFSIARPDKEHCEDSYFASNDLITVADGLGVWSLMGVDGSKYPWELMKNIELFSSALSFNRSSFNILSKAAENTRAKGSTTCCLLLLKPDQPVLDAINIGDSGFFIYRQKNSELVLIEQSGEVVHRFNHPFNLGTDGDPVASGWTKEICVENNDIVVMFTDGITDNLYEHMIRDLLKEELENGFDPEKIAEKIANAAFEYSNKEDYDSPFSRAYLQHFRQLLGSGKPDDITVIIARVNIISN